MLSVSDCTDRPILSPCGLKNLDCHVDTYVGCEHYCYYFSALADAETDWSNEIKIHSNIVDQLKEEIDDIPPQTLYMGYQTDPYQPIEAGLSQTGKVLELFLEKGFSTSILTKSDLVLRDIDILKEMNDSAVSISVAFNNSETRSYSKPIPCTNRLPAGSRLNHVFVPDSSGKGEMPHG